jgi:hypothetical protein
LTVADDWVGDGVGTLPVLVGLYFIFVGATVGVGCVGVGTEFGVDVTCFVGAGVVVRLLDDVGLPVPATGDALGAKVVCAAVGAGVVNKVGLGVGGLELAAVG